MNHAIDRRTFLAAAAAASLSPSLAAAAPPRPADGGLYWAWWAWEPLDHYRRTGGVVGAVDADSPHLDAWQERLHSEALVRQMTGLGINVAMTHFWKGFGLKHERDHQQQTRRLVEIGHRHGLKVLGYAQSRSLYYETLLLEEPAAESWVQLDEDGRKRTWGGAYFRWAPCIHAREFRDYLKRVIDVGLGEVGLDGFHFDNDYCEPCYCPRCEAAFRQWLTRRHPGGLGWMGLGRPDAVRQPPSATAKLARDPLVRQWIRFRCEALAEYHRELAEHARRQKPDVLLLGNPAYPRSLDEPGRRGVWMPMLGKHLDLAFAENAAFAGVEGKVLVSQVRAYKEAAAVGYRVVSTVWRRNKLSALGLPTTAGEVALQVAEAAANRGVPGTNWALRPGADGAGMQIDREELRRPLAESLAFVRTHQSLCLGGTPVADVAVLHALESRAFDPAGALRTVAVEESLLRGGFSWQMVFADDLARLSAVTVLVVAGQTFLAEEAIAALARWVDGGGRVILVGDNGGYDDVGRRRANDPWRGLPQDRVVRLPADVAEAKVEAAHGPRAELPRGRAAIAAAVEKAAARRLTVRMTGSDTVTVSAYRQPDGRLAVHLVNYAERPAEGLTLRLGSDASAAVVHRPEAESVRLDARRNGAQVELALPPVAVYAIVEC